jgi:acyl-CoA thioester hydrolase
MLYVAPDPSLAVTATPVRVRFGETDLMGIVHHASYLSYVEVARVEWLRRRGVQYADWARRGMHLPVVEATLRYRAPAKFDDVLDVEARLGELRAASLRFDYRITRGAPDGDPVLIAEGSTRLACVDDRHSVRRFTDEMISVLRSGETR